MPVHADQTSALQSLHAFVEERAIESFRAGGVTIDGSWRARHVPARELLAGKALGSPDAVFGADLRFDFYEPRLGYTGADHGLPDFALVPDLATVRAIPWAAGQAAVICDYHEWDGSPVEIAPRHVLRRVVERCRAVGFEPLAAVELEIYAYRETPETLRAKRYTGLEPLSPLDSPLDPSLAGALLQRWTQALDAYGLTVASAGTELGAGHLEVNLSQRPALEAADAAVLYKHALRELAGAEDLTVTFMARPETTLPPSSGHVHVSLWDGDRNAFWGERDQLPQTLGAYLAGSVASLGELALLALPTINSYRRIEPYRGSPTTATWGPENRTAALRTVTHTPRGARVEHRLAGADANPYLSVAAALAGGVAGIERWLEPPPPVTGDAWAVADAEPVPRTLERAIELFEASELARDLLGERFCDHYAATRRWELARFAQAVTDCERERYLERV
jgi:glutamine synthetase